MKSFYFTKRLDAGIPYLWGYVEVIAQDSTIARQLMRDKYGLKWGFEYHELEEIHPADRTLIDTIKQQVTSNESKKSIKHIL